LTKILTHIVREKLLLISRKRSFRRGIFKLERLVIRKQSKASDIVLTLTFFLSSDREIEGNVVGD
jgi:hypothetical protein